jgi:hypothetical protein
MEEEKQAFDHESKKVKTNSFRNPEKEISEWPISEKIDYPSFTLLYFPKG